MSQPSSSSTALVEGDSTPSAAEQSPAESGVAGISKRQMKRDARRSHFNESWEAKKAAKKAKQKANKQAVRDAKQAEWDALPEDEKEASRQRAAAARVERVAALQAAAAAVEQGPVCVVDCDFDDLMTDREVTSLSQQLMYAYGANRRAAKPLQYHITSVRGRVDERLHKIDGFDQWRATAHAGSYLDAFPRDRLVYLSSEGTTTLSTLDADKIYVIGGLVDHNRYKGLTHERATAAGIETARLPIDEHVQMSQRRVLAVNHVFEILLQYANCADWAAALLAAMPQRRGAQAREHGDGDDNEGEGEGEAWGEGGGGGEGEGEGEGGGEDEPEGEGEGDAS